MVNRQFGRVCALFVHGTNAPEVLWILRAGYVPVQAYVHEGKGEEKQ